MTPLNYKTARRIPIGELEIGDQMLSPYGYRVVHDIQEHGTNVEIYFWDEDPITRPAGSTVTAMKRWTQT